MPNLLFLMANYIEIDADDLLQFVERVDATLKEAFKAHKAVKPKHLRLFRDYRKYRSVVLRFHTHEIVTLYHNLYTVAHSVKRLNATKAYLLDDNKLVFTNGESIIVQSVFKVVNYNTEDIIRANPINYAYEFKINNQK